MKPWAARYSQAVVTPLDAEVAREVVLDLGGRPRLADLAQIVEERREQRRRALGEVTVSSVERGLHALPRLLRVEQVGVDRLEEGRIERHRLRDHLAVGEQAGPITSTRASGVAARGSTAPCSRGRRG